MRLEHISTIQKRHLAILLDPDLVPGVRRDYRQGGDVQSEFARLGELSEADAEGEEVVARNRGGKVGKRFADVVDSRALLYSQNTCRNGGTRKVNVPARGRHCDLNRRRGLQ